METDLAIRRATAGDAAAIAAIYNPYIRDTVITFEEEAVSEAEMADRIAEKLERHEWLVGESGGRIVGYAYYGSFRSRAAYARTVEATVYLERAAIGRGFGRALYGELIARARSGGFSEMIGGIALPNAASVALHERCGFVRVGLFPRVGYKLGRFVDVGFWQRSL
jgi:phosphinothricin acetyltransferase